MKMSFVAAAVVAVAMVSSTVLADSTIQGYVVSTGSGYGTNNRGGYQHKFWGASDSNTARFETGSTQANASIVRTFCTDPNFLNNASGTGNIYHLLRVTDAPYYTTGNAPGSTYTSAQETALNKVALASRDAGILDGRGFLSSAFQSLSDNVTIGTASFTRAKWVEGVQLAIWHALGIEGVGAPGANTAYAAIQALADARGSDPILVRILGVSNGSGNTNLGQDQMVLVPLPPAAYAGLGTLAGVLGFGAIRRRRLRAE